MYQVGAASGTSFALAQIFAFSPVIVDGSNAQGTPPPPSQSLASIDGCPAFLIFAGGFLTWNLITLSVCR